MNIVMVSQALPYLPAQDGFRLYAANMLRTLSSRHRVDLISLMDEGDQNHLGWARDHCATLTTIPLEGGGWNLANPINLVATYAMGTPLAARKRLSAVLGFGYAAKRWDVMHVEGGYAAGLIPSNYPLPRVLSVHDSWKLRYAQIATCSPRPGERLYYSLLKHIEPRYERLVYSRFDSCVVVGEADASAIRAVAPNCRPAVIPNGIDTEYYQPQSARTDNPTFAFHGNLDYAPNIHAAMEFSREIFPLIKSHDPQAVFRIIGAKPIKEIREIACRPGIKLFADLPDLRSILGSARIYVCPLRFGTGVNNKVLEAMALGLPIIAYPEAISGIDCTPGQHLLLADDPQQFARMAIDLLGEPQRADELGRAARRHVEENFSWESRATGFERLYHSALERWGVPSTVFSVPDTVPSPDWRPTPPSPRIVHEGLPTAQTQKGPDRAQQFLTGPPLQGVKVGPGRRVPIGKDARRA